MYVCVCVCACACMYACGPTYVHGVVGLDTGDLHIAGGSFPETAVLVDLLQQSAPRLILAYLTHTKNRHGCECVCV